MTVDPFTVWASRFNWGAIRAVVRSLRSPSLSTSSLEDVLNREDVSELRLMRGAVAFLGPAILIDITRRAALADLLKAIEDTSKSYSAFVDSSEQGNDDDAGVGPCLLSDVCASKERMAAAQPMEWFTPGQYSATWLAPPASVASYKAAYGLSAQDTEDFLASGVWAPSLPILRPMPKFGGDASTATDEPDCNHLMGRENKYTGGTFGVFCTCDHPKCVGVVVLDGSEGQRMPIEFIVERCVTMPSVVVHDFGRATLKTALCRMPFIARLVSFRVDRFHWRRNHVLCSKAMNPDSYGSMDGINTSSSEERNALSRRQEHHLRLMNQDNFIIFSVYQQALSNVIAMHKDIATALTPSKWPRWYREMFVDEQDFLVDGLA